MLPKDLKAFEPCHGVLILHVLSGETMIDRRFPCRTMSVGSQREGRKTVYTPTLWRARGMYARSRLPVHFRVSSHRHVFIHIHPDIPLPSTCDVRGRPPRWCVKISVNAASLIIPTPFYLLFHSSRSRFTQANMAFG